MAVPPRPLRAAVTSGGHLESGTSAALRRFAGANNMPPARVPPGRASVRDASIAKNCNRERSQCAAGYGQSCVTDVYRSRARPWADAGCAPVRRSSLSVEVSSSNLHVRTRSVRVPCGGDCRWATHRFREASRRTWMSVVQRRRPPCIRLDLRSLATNLVNNPGLQAIPGCDTSPCRAATDSARFVAVACACTA